MTSWVQNSWVVGIGGGIISGLVVFFITKWLFSSQGKREIARKVAAANQEVILAVRQGVPEGNIPTPLVLTSLVASTARKHGLQAAELYSAKEVSEDLIKEVMDSSFISADTKKSYCDQLSTLHDPPPKPATSQQPHALQAFSYVEKTRRSQVQIMSVTMALVAAFMSVLLPLATTELLPSTVTDQTELSLSSSVVPVLLPILATLGGLSTMAAVLAIWRARSAARAAEVAVKQAREQLGRWNIINLGDKPDLK